MTMLKITDEIREAARRILAQPKSRMQASDLRALKAIAEGRRKLVWWDWWEEVHGDIAKVKLDRLAAMADPKRNPNEHERRVAAVKLAEAKARRPPGFGFEPEYPPLPETRPERTPKPGRPGTQTPPPAPDREPVSDSVAPPPALAPASDSVAAKPVSDSVARLRALNAKRAAKRAAARAGLTCQQCGKPLTALRPTARFCGPTCRSQAWRA